MELYNFLEDKLSQITRIAPVIQKSERTFKIPTKGVVKNIGGEEEELRTLMPDMLKTMIDELLELDCFKNTKKINIVSLPTFLIDKESGDPLDLVNSDDYLGGETMAAVVVSMMMNEETYDDIEFAEVVDIYTIGKNPYDVYDTKASEGKPGVWVYPTLTTKNNFNPYRKIEVIWSPEQMQDLAALSSAVEGESVDLKQVLVNRFKKALDDGLKINIPVKPQVFIRLSSRSIIRKEIEA